MHHVNPTCGDEVTLRVHVTGTGDDAVVEDVSYDAMGCSISVASASILAEEITGESVAHARETFEAMRAMLTSKGEDPGDEEQIGDGVALSGVREEYIARDDMARLSWLAFTGMALRLVVADPAGRVLEAAAVRAPWRKSMMTELPHHVMANWLTSMTGPAWFYVASGAFLIALKETYELVEGPELADARDLGPRLRHHRSTGTTRCRMTGPTSSANGLPARAAGLTAGPAASAPVG